MASVLICPSPSLPPSLSLSLSLSLSSFSLSLSVPPSLSLSHMFTSDKVGQLFCYVGHFLCDWVPN